MSLSPGSWGDMSAYLWATPVLIDYLWNGITLCGMDGHDQTKGELRLMKHADITTGRNKLSGLRL